ncbi:MAG: response regulator [Calditrichaceae bacterium]|nr:response regulator [Calditrichaceae bacterium]
MAKTVFIVEDDYDIAEVLKFNLVNKGYNVVWEENGEEAYEKIIKSVPDLLILDLALPGISGIEICRYLKNNPITKKMPIIILTAKIKKEDREAGINAGADDFITKPFTLKDVLKRVEKLIKISV